MTFGHVKKNNHMTKTPFVPDICNLPFAADICSPTLIVCHMAKGYMAKPLLVKTLYGQNAISKNVIWKKGHMGKEPYGKTAIWPNRHMAKGP
jgi:hypothetical protein